MTAKLALKQIWADADAIAKREDKRLTWLLLLRYQLFFPPAQYVFQFRRRMLLAHIPLIGRLLARISWQRQCKTFAGDLSPGAQIGTGLNVPHPYGIVIGKGVRMGAGVTVYQNATIGVGADTAYPVVEDDALIGAGAVILGAITIGRGARIGANAVVLQDVPEGATAVGNPARTLLRRGTALNP